jgi:hypothetical protein
MKTCLQCNAPFEIYDRDREFYKKVALTIGSKLIPIPEPTLCPLCRQRRRFSFRNERYLYRRKCNGSGKEIISMYPPESIYKVYAQDVWWQTNWDGTAYGRDFDFSRPFFEQFAELSKDVPRIALLNNNSENSEYCNFTGDVKNSYLIFGSVYSEDCYYGSPYYSKNCVDTLVLRECELCYECIDCRKLYHSFYSQDCNNSDFLLYCFDLQNCSECIGCAGLRGKKNCIFNKQYSKVDYLKFQKDINLCDPEFHKMITEKFEEIKNSVPRQAILSTGSENVSGSHVFSSKNTFESFIADRCEDCSHCSQVVDLKDCYDNNYTEENELCYEYLGMYGTRKTLFSIFCRNTNEAYYSDYLVNCQYVFGCTNLHNKKYCILNKQYTQEEYEKLVPKIAEHMQKTPSSGGLSTEWGEFFPVSISPFSYNETVAQEYFPLTKPEVEKFGWKWRNDDKKEFQPQTVQIPKEINEVPDTVCSEILACEITGKNFRIIPQELAFYKKMHLPTPRRHPDQRHKERIEKRNPRKLFNRNCDKCGKQIVTSYPPKRLQKYIAMIAI